MTGLSWHRGCPVALDDLRLVRARHWGFDGACAHGRLVVNRDVAAGARASPPALPGAVPDPPDDPVDAYGGERLRSIEADNTSAFNCRHVDGTTRWSQHAYGRAIDLNPIENPYVTSGGTTSHRGEPCPTSTAPRTGRDGRRGRRRSCARSTPSAGAGAVAGRGDTRLPALLRERPLSDIFSAMWARITSSMLRRRAIASPVSAAGSSTWKG